MSDTLHVSAADLPASQPVTSYLSMLDQQGHPWWLWVDDTPAPRPTDWRPEGIDLASRQVFSWVYWKSPSGLGWYIWPAGFEMLNFSTERPSGDGTTMLFPAWWSPGRYRWTMTLSEAPELIIAGEGTIVVPQVHSVQICRRCGWVGHLDRSNARRDQEGNPMLDRCPRDGTTFYAEDEE